MRPQWLANGSGDAEWSGNYECLSTYASKTSKCVECSLGHDIRKYGVFWSGSMSRKTDEETLQIMVSPSIKKAIRALAVERDETIRSLILRALRDAGLPLDEAELVDRRKVVGQ